VVISICNLAIACSRAQGTAVANFKPLTSRAWEITQSRGAERRKKGRPGSSVATVGESQGLRHRARLTGETMPLSTRVVFDVAGRPPGDVLDPYI